MTINDIIRTVDILQNFIKGFKNFSVTGITLTNNEIKKVIKSFGNREILLKGTTIKITNQEGGMFLFQLGLSTAMSATDAAIQNNIHGSGTTALITSNEKTEDIIKTVKPLDESGLVIKGIIE